MFPIYLINTAALQRCQILKRAIDIKLNWIINYSDHLISFLDHLYKNNTVYKLYSIGQNHNWLIIINLNWLWIKNVYLEVLQLFLFVFFHRFITLSQQTMWCVISSWRCEWRHWRRPWACLDGIDTGWGSRCLSAGIDLLLRCTLLTAKAAEIAFMNIKLAQGR